MTIPTRFATTLFAALLVSATVWAGPGNVTDPGLPRALPADGPVAVSWTDPAQFIEIRHSRNRFEAVRGDWVREIAAYLREDTARHLPQGDRLDVTITDINRAGEYEPSDNGSYSIRYMRDIYPPRINLRFKLTGADGTVLAQGARELTDPGYLTASLTLTDTDPLRYEKKLVDDWQRQEFDAAGL